MVSDGDGGEDTQDEGEMVTDEAVVETAASAAHDVVFSRLDTAAVDDLDVTVNFEAGRLTVEVEIFAPESDADVEQIAEDATLAAGSAVDDLFAVRTGEGSGKQEDEKAERDRH